METHSSTDKNLAVVCSVHIVPLFNGLIGSQVITGGEVGLFESRLQLKGLRHLLA
jgi:hypothetical protein